MRYSGGRVHLRHRLVRPVAGPYRMYFHSHEPNEPPHIHVDRDNRSAKFWLQSVALARNVGFNAQELNEIQRIVRAEQATLWEA